METPLDAIDIQILRELQLDGRLSIVDLATRVGLSPSPCLRRVRYLEERGIILGYRAVVDPAKLDLSLQFLVSFRVAREGTEGRLRSMEGRREIRAALLSYPEVISVYSVTGEVDAVMRVAVPSFQAYERFLEDKILPLPVNDLLSRFVIGTRKPTAPYDLSHIQPVATSDPAADAPAARRRKRR